MIDPVVSTLLPMSILILNYEYPPLGGGAGISSLHQAQGLSALGHKVTIITTHFGDLPEEEHQTNLHIIRLKAHRRYAHLSTIREKLSWMTLAKRFALSYCKKHPFDVCVAHFSIPGGWVARALKRQFEIPFVIVSHAHDIPWFLPRQMFFYHLILQRTIKRICLASDSLVVLNKQLQKTARSFLPSSFTQKIHIIPNGCDTSFFCPNSSVQKTELNIIFTGRLVAQKKPFVFLNALKILKGKNINFSAHIIGNGPLESPMRSFVKSHGLYDMVTFRGWVSKDEMLKAYQEAHIQVICSKAEGMSMALLESLSCGIFVICSKETNINNLVQEGKNGSIIDKIQPSNILEAIIKYKANYFDKALNIDQETLNLFRNKHNYMNIVTQYEKLLAEIKK